MIYRSKKANFAGGVYIMFTLVIALFAFVLIQVLGGKLMNDFNTDFQADNSFNNESKEVVSGFQSSYASMFESMSLTIIGLFWLFGMVISFLTDTNPIFFIILFLVGTLLLVVGGIMSNTWEDFVSDSDTSFASTSYPITNYLMNNYVLVIMVLFSSFMLTNIIRGRFT